MTASSSPHPHVVLIACSASKVETSTPIEARSLYTGQLFKLSLEYAEHAGALPFVLSAAHGLVLIDEPLATYDFTLSELSAREREGWGERAMSRLCLALQFRVPSRVEVLAPKLYAESVFGQLRFFASEHTPAEKRWPAAEYPLKGLGIGMQKKLLADRIRQLTREPIDPACIIRCMTHNDSRPPPPNRKNPDKPYTLDDLFVAIDAYREACRGDRATVAYFAALQMFEIVDEIRSTWAPAPVEKGMSRVVHVRVAFLAKLHEPYSADDEIGLRHLYEKIGDEVGQALNVGTGQRRTAVMIDSATCEMSLSVSERLGARAARRDASGR